MKIDIVDVFYEDDEDMSGDSVTHLFIDGQYVVHGDYYHDKISEYIDGFLAGIEFLTKKPLSKSKIKHHNIRSDDICDFKDTLKEFLKTDLNKTKGKKCK